MGEMHPEDIRYVPPKWGSFDGVSTQKVYQRLKTARAILFFRAARATSNVWRKFVR